MRLSVIIPAYNEENRLQKTLFNIDGYLRRQNYDYEIIVVNGGSKDKTEKLVLNLISQIANLKLINIENRGKGFAVRQGFFAAKGDYKIFTDADNSTSIDQIEKIWAEFKQGYDVVIGSRDIKGSVISVAQSWIRITLGNIFNLIAQIISGLWGIKDTQCGFKGFSAKAAEDIFSRAKIERWAFDVEVLVIAKKLGYKIKEIPVTWVNDTESKVRFFGIVKMLFEVLEVRWNLMRHKYDR